MNSIKSIRRIVEWLWSGQNRYNVGSSTGGISRGGHHVPSPLNGEKVAKGRMRGGETFDFSSHIFTFQCQLALSPLTPALSPCRGEGELSAALFHGLRALLPPSRTRSGGIVFSFGSDCLNKGTFPNNTPRLPFACQR